MLAIRGTQSELSCKRCGELESISHLFISGPFATEFWSKAPLTTTTAASPPHDRSPRLANISWKKAALPPLGIISSPLIPWLMWNLWTVRNKLVFESKVFQVEDIVSKAVAEARVWEDANSRKKKVQGRSPLSG